jgi:hypothetical protein
MTALSNSVKKKRFILLLAVFLGIILTPLTLWSQQIAAEVNVMLERLPIEKQQRLKDFARDIETYINDHDWTGEIVDSNIPVSIQIFLQDNSVNYESRYAGTFLVTNQDDIQYFDKYWRFPYQFGERLYHQEGVFHPFTGFLDFYIYLIIGGEYDKLGKMLGTPYFEKAKYVSDQAKFNSQFILGWDEREKLIDFIMSDDNITFREMKDIFFLGLSYIGEEDSTARKYCTQALSMIENVLEYNPDHEEALNFMKSHHIDFINMFRGNREILEKLMYIDPDRAETYKKYLDE